MLYQTIIFSIGLLFLFRLVRCDILSLTDDSFLQQIVEKTWILVIFESPWCHSCKKLKVELEKASQVLLKSDPSVLLGIVDCSDKGTKTCNQFSISSYPKLKLFNHGKLYHNFEGPKEFKGLIKYVKAHVGSPVQLLSSPEELEEFLNDDYVSVVAFLDETSPLRDIIQTTAQRLKGKFFFGIMAENSSYVSNCMDFNNSIVLFRPEYLHNNFEEKHLKFRDKTNEEFEKWLFINKHGLVGHRTKQNSEDFLLPIVITYYNIDYKKNPKGTNYWRNRILKVAHNYSNEFIFAMSPKDEFQLELLEFGYGFYTDKIIVVAKTTEHKKYRLEKDFSVENFINFLEGIKNGILEPYFKSEPIPEVNDRDVKVAVAKNFDEIVIKNDKDTVLQMNAPWCLKCKKLDPIFEDLAVKLKNENLVFVKMNARKNELLPAYEVKKYPTIFFCPKMSKFNPILYEEDEYESNGLIKFIALHSTEELRGYDRDGISRYKYEL